MEHSELIAAYVEINRILGTRKATNMDVANIGAALLADATFQFAGENGMDESTMLNYGGGLYAESLARVVAAATKNPQ